LIWVFDNRVPQNPISISTFPTPAEADYKSKGGHFGDVFVDAKGLIYATDYNAGFYILEFSGA
jgi:hypothetical protein